MPEQAENPTAGPTPSLDIYTPEGLGITSTGPGKNVETPKKEQSHKADNPEGGSQGLLGGKFKTTDDLIKSYTNAESRNTQLAQERAALQKELSQAQELLKQMMSNVSKKDEPSFADLYNDNPVKAVSGILEDKFSSFQKQMEENIVKQLARTQAQSQLVNAYPELVQDENFRTTATQLLELVRKDPENPLVQGFLLDGLRRKTYGDEAINNARTTGAQEAFNQMQKRTAGFTEGGVSVAGDIAPVTDEARFLFQKFPGAYKNVEEAALHIQSTRKGR